MSSLSSSPSARDTDPADRPYDLIRVEQAEALAALVASMPGMVILLSRDGTVLAESEEWAYAFGSEADLDAMPRDLNQADEIDLTQNTGDNASEKGQGFESFFEQYADSPGINGRSWSGIVEQCIDDAREKRGYDVKLVMPDGAVYWIDVVMRPWSSEHGDVQEGVLINVTERSEAHQATSMRRQIEDRFDILIETISEGVLLMDSTGVFRDCNRAAEQILGRTSADIIGSKFSDDLWSGLKEDGTPLPNAEFPFWQAVVERDTIKEEVMGMYPPGGPPRWIRVNAQPLFEAGEEEPYGVLACFEDITEEQLKDEALQTSKDLLSSVLSSSLDGIIVFSAIRDDARQIVDFECLLVNPQAEKMINRSSEDLVGSRMLMELPGHDDSGLFDAYAEVVETGEPLETELHYSSNDFDRWLQIVAVRIEDGVAVTFRDISERKRSAQAMAATNAKLEQRNRALRDFAYIASHDLQEPLRKIGAFSNLVLDDYGDVVDDTGKHYLERMQDAARRMSQLISDLLVYSRVTTQARPFRPVDLEKIVDNVTTDLEMQIEDVDGTVDVGALPTIEADATQIRQLLQNLIGNGLKFHRPDVPPVVTIRSETLDADDDSLPALDADARIFCRITVQDNGIGFEQKYADRIFTPFKRLHGRSEYSGTGMGLAICRRIVERHGGNIDVESTPGEGTTFTVQLPVDRQDGDMETESSVQDHAKTETTLDE